MSAPRPSGPTRTLHRLALTGLIVGTLPLIGALAVAPSAAAHDELLSTSPLDGDILGNAPRTVELVFSADILDVGTAVIVMDDASVDHAAGEPELAGTTLTQPLDDLPDGSYSVRWRVVSGDGHPIAGAFDFSIGDPGPITSETVAPAPSPVAPTSGIGSLPPDDAVEPAAMPVAAVLGDLWSDAPLWQITVLGGLLGLSVYAVILRLTRGRR